MKKVIVYLRTDYWGVKGHVDLIFQEERCLAYAETKDWEVVRVFKEKPKKRQSTVQMTQLFQYLQENASVLKSLVVYHPRNLARYKMDFISLVKKIRGMGIRVTFVINHVKSKDHEN